MRRLAPLILVSLLALVPVAPAADDSRSAKLAALYAEYWEENLKLNPVTATQAGDPRYNAELPDLFSLEHRDALKSFHQKYLDRARSIVGKVEDAGLSGQDRLSYDVFTLNRESEIEDLKFPRHLLPFNQFYNFGNSLAQLGSGVGAQPFKTVKDYDDWLKRAARAPTLIDTGIANMREGVKAGLVQPKILMERMLPQLDANAVDDVEKSVFWGPIERMPKDFPAADRDRLTAAFRELISKQLTPAYRKLRKFVAEEYLPRCRDTFGLGALPNGAAWYEHQVRDNTLRSMTPAKVHQIGLDEVARLQDAMRGVAKDLAYPKPVKTLPELKAFFEWVKARDDMYFTSRDELLKTYQSFGANVAPLLPKYFNLRPKTDYEVRLVEPFREASASAGQYQGPSLDGTRPGIFFVNAYDLKARPKSALAALSLHEAAPGHHFQISLQRELKDLPMFRRFSGDTAYNEGWGLYAEWLGYEMDIYKDPVQRFGAIDAELWRAIRLVTDSGIHFKGWTRQQTLDYMFANSPAEITRAVSEAERFSAIPGQALAYKIGQLKFIELRKRAEKALGKKFDVAKFHDEMLRDGAMPLEVLEAKTDRWIASQR
jgi:uncharacterized protein (DUF885 family)